MPVDPASYGECPRDRSKWFKDGRRDGIEEDYVDQSSGSMQERRSENNKEWSIR